MNVRLPRIPLAGGGGRRPPAFRDPSRRMRRGAEQPPLQKLSHSVTLTALRANSLRPPLLLAGLEA
jgi:hypothetical protein